MSARGRRCGRSRAAGRRAVRTNAGRNPAPPARASRPHPNWAGARRVPRVSPARPGRPVRVARGVRVRTFVPFGMRLSIVVVICARGERVRGQDSVAGASTTRGRRPAREGAAFPRVNVHPTFGGGGGARPPTRRAHLDRLLIFHQRGDGGNRHGRDARGDPEGAPSFSARAWKWRTRGEPRFASRIDSAPLARGMRLPARRWQPGAIGRRLFAQCAARSFSRAATSLASGQPPPRRAPLLRAVTRVRAPGRRTRRARPARARHARRFRSGRTTRSRSPDPRVRIRGVGPPRGHRRASPRERLPSRCRTLGSITRTPSWTVRCALVPTPRLARASPREPPPLGSRPTSRPPPRPRPNRHFDPVLLSRFVRSPHFAPPPPPLRLRRWNSSCAA